MKYLCNKAITLNGKTYHPGDTIPDGVVLETRVRMLAMNGYLSAMENAPVSQETASAPKTVKNQNDTQISTKAETKAASNVNRTTGTEKKQKPKEK